MSKSTRKIVAGLLSFAMVLTLVVGLAAVPASAQTTFTRNLTIGSTGADVTALQTILYSAGYLKVNPTGYFGTLTRAALAAWQAANGVSPAVGYFGPITRAAISVGGNPTVPPVTGTPGCPVGAIYNYLTGARCDTVAQPPSSSTEGSLTVSAAPTPANNANVQTSTDVPVYGLDLEAKLGDVTVNRMDLNVSVYNSGYENPGNFINTIKIWNGSTLVKSWSVGTGDFITGTSSTNYYIRLSGIGFVVPKDMKKTLTVSFSTNGGIDNDRTIGVTGQGTNSLLTTSGNNITSYYDISGISRSHTFKKPGTATLTLAADANNPMSQTYRVNSSATTAANVTLLTFTVKSETGDSKITAIAASSSASTTSGPTALYLYDGSTLLASVSVGSWTAYDDQSISFNNLSLVIPKDTTKVLTITGDFQPSTTNGTSATVGVNSVTYQKPNGTSATASATITGNAQYVFTVSPQWTLVSGGTPSAVYSGAGNSQTLDSWSNTFVLKAKPVGGNMVKPVTGDFAGTVTWGSSGSAAATVSDVSVVGSPTLLSEGSEYTVNVTMTVATTSVDSGTQVIKFNLTRASSSVNGTQVIQTWGLNNFQSNTLTVAGGTN